MSNEDLSGQTAVITGGSRGIGKAIAKKFAEEGANLMLAARGKDGLESACEEISNMGGSCDFVSTDVTEMAQVKNLFEKTKEKYSSVNIMANNAGRESVTSSIADTSLEEWETTHDVNLKGTFLCSREAFKIMREQQSHDKILNIGSSSGKMTSSPGKDAYRSSKHGVMGLTKNLLQDAREESISVTVINPATIRTSMIERYLKKSGASQEEREELYRKCVDPKEVADVALLVVTTDPDTIIPQVSIYPRHEIGKYGMNV